MNIFLILAGCALLLVEALGIFVNIVHQKPQIDDWACLLILPVLAIWAFYEGGAFPWLL